MLARRLVVLGDFRSQQPQQLGMPNRIFGDVRVGKQPLIVRYVLAVDETLHRDLQGVHEEWRGGAP